MKKIPTIFQRDPDDMARVLPIVNPDCQWVLDGEGIATRKYDGTCVMRDDKGWWGRREVKPGKVAPEGFVDVDFDSATGKRQGWEPIEQTPFIKAFREAIDGKHGKPHGTYELCGPKINGNPEGYDRHVLIAHADAQRINLPPTLDFRTTKRAVTDLAIEGFEGIVWHHPDGRMAKLKARDFQTGVTP